MTETQEVSLQRSPSRLSRDLFGKILTLTEIQPWLKIKQRAVISLIDECEDQDQQQMICELLERFTYLDGSQFSDAITSISKYIEKDLALSGENAVISAREISKYSDSSQMVAYHLKAFGGLGASWTTNRFVSGLGEVIEARPDDVVLVDEFMGTGESMEKSVVYLRGKAEEAKHDLRIHCAVVASMDFGIERVQKVADSLFTVHTLVKGISGAYPQDQAPKKIELMLKLEAMLADQCSRGKLTKHSLGYKKSEALYSRHEGNTPNNVFPVFWWDFDSEGHRRDRLLECR